MLMGHTGSILHTHRHSSPFPDGSPPPQRVSHVWKWFVAASVFASQLWTINSVKLCLGAQSKRRSRTELVPTNNNLFQCEQCEIVINCQHQLRFNNGARSTIAFFCHQTLHCKKRCSTNIKPILKVILYLTQRPQHVLLFGINWICYLVDWSVASRKGLVGLELSQVSLQSRWYMPFSGKCWMQHAILFSQLFTDAAAAANMEMLCKYLPTNQMYNIPNVHFIQNRHHQWFIIRPGGVVVLSR